MAWQCRADRRRRYDGRDKRDGRYGRDRRDDQDGQDRKRDWKDEKRQRLDVNDQDRKRQRLDGHDQGRKDEKIRDVHEKYRRDGQKMGTVQQAELNKQSKTEEVKVPDETT